MVFSVLYTDNDEFQDISEILSMCCNEMQIKM
jgi:hypothetical protein